MNEDYSLHTLQQYKQNKFKTNKRHEITHSSVVSLHGQLIIDMELRIDSLSHFAVPCPMYNIKIKAEKIQCTVIRLHT